MKQTDKWYIVPVGIRVLARKRPSREWFAWSTRREVQVRGFLYRTSDTIVLRWGERWELRVRDGDCIVSGEPLPEGAAAHLARI